MQKETELLNTKRNDIIIRKATLTDTLKLSVLFKQVYIQTYGLDGVTDEYANFITNQFAVEKLEHTIRNAPDNITVAVYKDNLVGVAEIEWNSKCPLGNLVAPELSKLYVLEWFSGIGVGYRLLKAAEEVILLKGFNELWLWVYLYNPKAIAFYERQGYNSIGNAFYQMEFNNYENMVMFKKLK